MKVCGWSITDFFLAWNVDINLTFQFIQLTKRKTQIFALPLCIGMLLCWYIVRVSRIHILLSFLPKSWCLHWLLSASVIIIIIIEHWEKHLVQMILSNDPIAELSVLQFVPMTKPSPLHFLLFLFFLLQWLNLLLFIFVFFKYLSWLFISFLCLLRNILSPTARDKYCADPNISIFILQYYATEKNIGASLEFVLVALN